MGMLTIVTVLGAGGATIDFGFDDSQVGAQAQIYASVISSAVLGGTAIPFIATGAALPTVAGGQTIEIIDHIGLGTTLPGAVPAAVISDAPVAATVSGGTMGGDYILAGQGGIAYTSGAGINAVFAGGGSSRVDIAAGMGGGYFFLGNGDNTVNAIGGNNQIQTGTGHNVITTGIGTNFLNIRGTDTVFVGPGNVNISANGQGASTVVLLGSGSNRFTSGGSATIVGSSGADIVNSLSGAFFPAATTVFLAGSGISQFTGAGTVVGGSGDLYTSTGFALGPAGQLVFAGSKNNTVGVQNGGGGGATTVVGNATGATTIFQSQGDLVAFTRGTTQILRGNGYGSDTVIGIDGSLTVIGGSGLFLGAPGGNNQISADGDATIFGTTAGDVLTADTSGYHNDPNSHIAIVGGTGAETISGAGSHAILSFYGGTGPEFIQAGDRSTQVLTGTGAETIAGGNGMALFAFVSGNHTDAVMQNFDPAKDYFALIGFGTGEAATALVGATISGGSEHLTLSDGTHITLQGFSGLVAGNFL